jgi:hypothetical protein
MINCDFERLIKDDFVLKSTWSTIWAKKVCSVAYLIGKGYGSDKTNVAIKWLAENKYIEINNNKIKIIGITK